MTPLAEPTLPPELGYRFATLVDGEGSFVVKERKGAYWPSLQVAVRDDDAAWLRDLTYRTGVGRLYAKKGQGGGSDLIVWVIQRKADTEKVAGWLWEYRPASKKLWDCMFWILVVWARSGFAQGRAADWAFIAEAKRIMEQCRKYGAHPAAVVGGDG